MIGNFDMNVILGMCETRKNIYFCTFPYSVIYIDWDKDWDTWTVVHDCDIDQGIHCDVQCDIDSDKDDDNGVQQI